MTRCTGSFLFIENSIDTAIIPRMAVQTQGGVTMGAAMSLDVTRERIEVAIRPKLRYTPTILSIRGQTSTVEIHADEEQLAEIMTAINEHLQTAKEEIA